MKYYLAYGSNLSVDQMEWRCPDASYIGYGFINDYRLLFRRGFLTIEHKAGYKVPVLVWIVSDADERSLDRYEGFPTFYRKEEMTIRVHSLNSSEVISVVDAFVYIMNDEFPLQGPKVRYWDICAEGYHRFGFDVKILKKALFDSARR